MKLLENKRVVLGEKTFSFKGDQGRLGVGREALRSGGRRMSMDYDGVSAVTTRMAMKMKPPSTENCFVGNEYFIG